MFKTQDIIGDVIFMAFNDKKMLNHVGLNIECGHFKIMGYDNFGLWVEHPGLFVVKWLILIFSPCFISFCATTE